jgi:hypothetical protein
MMPDAVEGAVARAVLTALAGLIADAAPGGRDAFLCRLQERADFLLVPVRPSSPRAQRDATQIRRSLADLIASARRVRP